jgi:hypothetical protein
VAVDVGSTRSSTSTVIRTSTSIVISPMVMIRETITVMGTEAAEAMAVVATHRETIHMEVDASMRPARCMPRLATLP